MNFAGKETGATALVLLRKTAGIFRRKYEWIFFWRLYAN